MKVAIPTANGLLCEHFGHCQEFVLLEVDPDTKQILGSERVAPPAHEPGVFPQWLGGLGVNLVIAGGMGMRAVQLFQAQGIQVVSGAPPQAPDAVVTAYLNSNLSTDANPCNRGDGPCEGHGQNH